MSSVPTAARVLAVLGVTLVLTQEAHAYLDPGTGSLLLQGLLAALFGSMFFLRQTWSNLLLRVKFWVSKPENSSESSADS